MTACRDCGRYGYHFHDDKLVQSPQETIEGVRLERNILRSELNALKATCQAHMEARFNAERDLRIATEQLGAIADEHVEIRATLAWYHEDHRRIQVINDLAYRIWTGTQTAVPPASAADYAGGPPSPPPATFSSRGLTAEEGAAYEEILGKQFGGTD